MAAVNWHDRLQTELARRGLPASYIRRVVEELRDHSEDIEAETPGSENTLAVCAEQRLGSPHDVASAVQREYQQGSFLGRHPALTFLLAPIPCTLLISIFQMWLVSFCLQRIWPQLVSDDRIELPGEVLLAIQLTFLVVPALIGSIAFCWLTRRLARGTGWLVASCSIVTLASGITAGGAAILLPIVTTASVAGFFVARRRHIVPSVETVASN